MNNLRRVQPISPLSHQKVDNKPERLSINQMKPSSNAMNESMFSRMSELHSDGSILRRNNMRFGVKTPK